MPEQQSFNPISTFGNRQAFLDLIKKKDSTLNACQIPSNRFLGISQLQYNEGQFSQHNSQRQQTRIKVLNSFQESYLQSITNPQFTEANQAFKTQQNEQKFNLSYSKSKKNYLAEDSIRRILCTGSQTGHEEAKNSKNPSFQHATIQNQLFCKLRIQIEQENYRLAIQQRTFNFLKERIEGRGRNPRVCNSHLMVQKAINFMDLGEQFMKSIKKLNGLII